MPQRGSFGRRCIQPGKYTFIGGDDVTYHLCGTHAGLARRRGDLSIIGTDRSFLTNQRLTEVAKPTT